MEGNRQDNTLLGIWISGGICGKGDVILSNELSESSLNSWGNSSFKVHNEVSNFVEVIRYNYRSS